MTTNYEAWAEGWKAARKHLTGDYVESKEVENPYNPEEKPYVNHYYVNNTTISDPELQGKRVLEILEEQNNKRKEKNVDVKPEVTQKDIDAKRALKKRRQEERNSSNITHSRRYLNSIDRFSARMAISQEITSLVELRNFYKDIGDTEIVEQISGLIIAKTRYLYEIPKESFGDVNKNET